MNTQTLSVKFENVDVTDEEFKRKKDGNRITTPGTYKASIVKAVCSGTCKNDSSWLSYKLTFQTTDLREVLHWIQIPTSSIRYNPNGGGRDDLFVFRKLQDFMYSMGEDLLPSVESLNTVLPKYVDNVKNFYNNPVEIIVGYQGIHISEIDNKFYVVGNKNEILPMLMEGFSSADEAEAAARGKGIEKIDTFMSVLDVIRVVDSSVPANVGF